MPRVKPTLHGAMKTILLRELGRTATLQFLSQEIERGDLWRRPSDGRYPEVFQIRLRAMRAYYQDRFEMVPPDKVRYIGAE